MFIGYARTSTPEQSLDLQTDALEKIGCEKIFSDQISGAKAKRPGLDQVWSQLRGGDTLVVWRLDRLSRTLRDLIEIVSRLESQGIGFLSLQEAMDTSTTGGKLIFHVFGALAEFERNVIRDRTRAGLDSARARGRVGGRPIRLDPSQKATLLTLYDAQRPIVEICQTMKVSKTTMYRYIRERSVGA